MAQDTAQSTGKRPAGPEVLALVGFLAAVFLVSAIGGLATSTSVGTWYRSLEKPAWTPPSWVFGPVWTALYLAMAVAAWLVWRSRPSAGRPLTPFWVQLGLNLAWSLVFFGLRAPGPGLAVIVLLLAAIVATMRAFAPHSRASFWLLVPYLLWVSYASTLNAGFWYLNRG